MKDTQRYEAGNVLLLEVEHLRAYRGESGELLYRMRTVAAEEEVMNAVLDGHAEPDWFVERWVDGEDGFGEAEKGRGVLVACLVFERADAAERCRRAIAEAIADGVVKLTHVRLREDDAMREEVARHFSEEWAKAHEREMAKVAEAYVEAVKWYGGRILVGWIEKVWFEKVSGVVKDATGLVAHAAVADDVLGRVNVCLGFRSMEYAAMCESALCVSLRIPGRFALPRIDMEDEVPRQMVVAMAKRLAAHDAKDAKAGKAAKKAVG